jgi:predicted CoA-binding protein
MSDHDQYPDGFLRKVLGSVRTIAMVGASPDWHKASSFAMKYLQSKGYRVIPVNPRAAGKTILGETCYARLSEIPESETRRIDMVDIFRNSEAAARSPTKLSPSAPKWCGCSSACAMTQQRRAPRRPASPSS